MEKVYICCLKGIGEKLKKHKLIPLEDKAEVVIGRAPDVTVCIPSPMISRKHAILSKTNNTWSITDKKSLNGAFVNGNKLTPDEPYLLNDGDTVQLGVASEQDKMPEFVWKYFTKCRVKKIKSMVKHKNSGLNDSHCTDMADLAPTQTRKRNKLSSDQQTDSDIDPPEKRQRQVSPSWSPSRDMQLKLQQQEVEAQKKLAEQEARLLELQAQLQQKERMQEQMREELQKKEEEMAQRLANQQKELTEQKQQLEEEVKRNYEREIQEKEKSLLNRLSQEKNTLQEEKRRVEESLQQEMERKLEEKDKNLESKLLAEKERLEKIIEQRDMEHLLLQNELDDSKSMAQQEQANILKVKEDILTNFTELMETELQCSICNELFVQATSLNCSHSFCALCIGQWMDVKKECPVCRTPITSHTRSLVLDSYIDRMAENLSAETKQKRQELVEERKAEVKRREQQAAACQAGTSSGRHGRRGRRGGRRGTGRGRVQTRAQAAVELIVVDSTSSDVDEAVHNSDSNSDSDLSESPEVTSFMNFSSSDSDSSLEGVSDAYYGGYGTCYRCGRRGHWANGCPFYL